MVIQNDQENEFLRSCLETSAVFFLTCLYGSISLSLSLSLYLSLSLCLSLSPSIHPSIHPYIQPSIQYTLSLINLSIQFVETVWLGGTDSTEEGSWTWTESTDAMTFTAWGPNQSNNYQNQDCLSLYMKFDLMWKPTYTIYRGSCMLVAIWFR